MSLSVKCPAVNLRIITANWCPCSPIIFARAGIACKIPLVYGNVRSENSIERIFPAVYLRREPVQLSGAGNLVCTVAIAILCRLIVGGVVLAETVGIKVVLHNRHRIRPVFKIILCQCRTADNSNRQRIRAVLKHTASDAGHAVRNRHTL